MTTTSYGSARTSPDNDDYVICLHYLLTWGARETSIAGEPSRVGGPALFDRRKALDWVLDAELDWDDVPLDT